MKRVGVLTRIENDGSKELLSIPLDIYNYLYKKVEVVIIPFNIDTSLNQIISLVKKCDGIILPGGDKEYKLEFKLIKYIYKENIPLLGICLGMQEMAITLNGCISTLKDYSHKSIKKYVHNITLNKDSKIYSILKNKNILVNSRHKDYVTNTSLNIGAYSSDNIIEEVEDPNKSFFIGVQWHPESVNDIYSQRLFNGFIKSL